MKCSDKLSISLHDKINFNILFVLFKCIALGFDKLLSYPGVFHPAC